MSKTKVDALGCDKDIIKMAEKIAELESIIRSRGNYLVGFGFDGINRVLFVREVFDIDISNNLTKVK